MDNISGLEMPNNTFSSYQTSPERGIKRIIQESGSVKAIKLSDHSIHQGHIPTDSASNSISNDMSFMPAAISMNQTLAVNMTPLRKLCTLPPIWAQSRQEVCESFDWFRSYQGGVYFANNITKGYLLSGYPAKRDGFFQDGKLIISHGGGKAESIQHTKGQTKLRLADDQKTDDKSVRALLTNYRQQIPVVLLIDDRYALFPFDLGARNITYAVLGVYRVTNVWAEREITKSGQKHVRFKFAFQWCEEQGQPWWLTPKVENQDKDWPMEPPIPTPLEDTYHNDSMDTDNARTLESDYETLGISTLSLNEEVPVSTSGSSSSNEVHQNPIGARRIPSKRSEFLLSERRPGRNNRTCSTCSMPNPHVFSEGWGCLNSTCPKFWTLADKGFLEFPDELKFDDSFLQLQSLSPIDAGFRNILPPQPLTSPSTGNATDQAFTKGMHCLKCGRLSCRFKWQHWECSHCHDILPVASAIRPARELKNHPTGATFEYNFVAKDSGITRTKTKFFGSEEFPGHVQTFSFPNGKGHIHHITHNNSARVEKQLDELFEEYQKQAADGSIQFRRWPLRSHKRTVISSSLHNLLKYSYDAVRGSLLTNYFSQNCGEPYHYVGGTANTVAWDQAPSAVLHAKQFIEERTQLALEKNLKFNEVLSAAYMEKQKMSFHTDDERGLGDVVAGLSLGSPALMHFRRRDVKHGPERKTCLSIILRHGDILVMDGAGVQEHYEHMAEPTNFRIAATARWISPNRN